MATRKASPHTAKKDLGAIFDAAVTRGALPKGVPPEEVRALRGFYVEHSSQEGNEEEWCETMLASWRMRNEDPDWLKRCASIGTVLRREAAFRKLDALPLLWNTAKVRDKAIEALAYALEGFEHHALHREVLQRRRAIADGDLRDARRRMGGVDSDLFQMREAAALKVLSEIDSEESHRSAMLTPKGIMDDLVFDLFAVIRHVTPCQSLDRVSDKRIRQEVMTPILKAFPSVNNVVPRRVEEHTVQVAPQMRVKRLLSVMERESAKDADIWRDGRAAQSRADLVWNARLRLFLWDPRFDRRLFLNR